MKTSSPGAMRRGSTLAVMALLVISVSVAAAQDTGSVNATSLFNTSTIYNKTGTLSPVSGLAAASSEMGL